MSSGALDLTDVSGYPGHADRVFAPETESELAAILRRAFTEKIPVTVCGALTGLAGGAAPQGGWAVSLLRMRKFDLRAGRAMVGPGVLLREVQAEAAVSRQFYAPDPTENTSSIGGNIAANASGSRSFRYGATRRHILSLRVALMDGSIVAFQRGQRIDFEVPRISVPRTTKHSAGYPLAPGMEWVDLFIGNEGTLGVVTEAELQLLPAPGERIGGVVFFRSEEDALEAVDRWRPTPGLNMIEYIDRGSLQMMDIPQQAALMVEIEIKIGGGAEIDMSTALESESWFATSSADRERLRRFRHALPEKANERVRRNGFVKLGTDFAAPLDKNREMLAVYRRVMEREAPGRYIIFGHVGDANLHVNNFAETASQFERGKEIMTELAREAVALGGTVGAEHGLGKRKAHLLEIQYPPDEIEAMKNVKRRFDPDGLLGRGTLLGCP